MKGADTVMSRIVQYSDWLEEEVITNLTIVIIVLIRSFESDFIPSFSVAIWPEKASGLWSWEKRCSVKNNMLCLR